MNGASVKLTTASVRSVEDELTLMPERAKLDQEAHDHRAKQTEDHIKGISTSVSSLKDTVMKQQSKIETLQSMMNWVVRQLGGNPKLTTPMGVAADSPPKAATATPAPKDPIQTQDCKHSATNPDDKELDDMRGNRRQE